MDGGDHCEKLSFFSEVGPQLQVNDVERFLWSFLVQRLIKWCMDI